MDYKRLETLQNNDILKGTIEKQVLDIELVLTELYQTTDDSDIKKTIYENLTEIKANLLWEWLNSSLLFNRVNILYETFYDYHDLDFLNSKKGMRQIGKFLQPLTQLEDVLKDSWIDIYSFDSLDSWYVRHYKSDVHKIIYSK